MKFLFYTFSILTITNYLVKSSVDDESLLKGTENEKYQNISSGHQLRVLSGFYSGNYTYQRTRRIKGESYPEPTKGLDDAMKQKMCETIFGNIYFTSRGKHPYRRSLLDKFPSRAQPEPIVSNENIVINVSFYATPRDKTIEESVFVCLCQIPSLGGLSTEVTKYYVSNEYNMSEKSDSYIAGRFLFAEDTRLKRILLESVAEEAGRTTLGPGYELERRYLQRKESQNELVRKASEDPLCKIWTAVKVRICSAVFNSRRFRSVEYSFVPDGIDGSCQKKTVSFKSEEAKVDAGEKKFEEWVMHCDPVQNDISFDYFLSRAYEDEELFVYVWDKWQEKLYLETLATHVRLRDIDIRYNYLYDE